ncbi:hypothetical protein DL96DRAFT_1723412 [Flagelloscypha sp. PMI_526]|nr:hypothetical protein DL96DRAFT_1723412 [Flagelloscypha sp. PMI_526]
MASYGPTNSSSASPIELRGITTKKLEDNPANELESDIAGESEDNTMNETEDEMTDETEDDTADETEDDITDELEGQVFQFDSEKICSMLSPKRLTAEWKAKMESNRDLTENKCEHPLLTDFTCLYDTPTVHNALQELSDVPFDYPPFANERASYEPLCKFLNSSIAECNSPKSERWFSRLRFYINDKPTRDAMDTASPDIVGLNDESLDHGNFHCTWGDPNRHSEIESCSTHRIHFSVGIDSMPRDLLRKCTSYARAGRSAAPERLWRIVFSFDQDANLFRFLIFHNGGLSASQAMNLKEVEGRKQVQQMLFAMILWQDAEDAGYPCFTNGSEMALPGNIFATIQETLWYSTSTCGRGTHVLRASFDPAPHGAPSPQLTTEDSHVQAERIDYGRFHNEPPTWVDGCTTESDRIRFKKHYVSCCCGHSSGTSDLGPRESSSTMDPAEQGSPTSGENPTIPAEFIVKMASPTRTQEGCEMQALSACSGLFGLPTLLLCFQAAFKSGRPVSNTFLFPVEDDRAACHWTPFGTSLPEADDVRPLIVIISLEEGVSLELCEDAWDLCECILHGLLGWLKAYEMGWIHRDPSIGNILKLKCARPDSSFTSLCSAPPSSSEDNLSLHFASLPAEEAEQKLSQLRQELAASLRQLGGLHECKAIVCDFDLSAKLEGYLQRDREKPREVFGTVEFMSTEMRDAIQDDCQYFNTPLDDLWAFFHTTTWATLSNIKNRPFASIQEKNWWIQLQGDVNNRDGAISRMGNHWKFQPSPMVKTMGIVISKWRAKLSEMQDAWRNNFYLQQPREGKESLFDFGQIAYYGVIQFVRILVLHKDELRVDL